MNKAHSQTPLNHNNSPPNGITGSSTSAATIHALSSRAEALSCGAVLAAVGPQLDGDDYARCPASALGQRAAAALDAEVRASLRRLNGGRRRNNAASIEEEAHIPPIISTHTTHTHVQDDEVSPWPRVAGVGDGPVRALAALAARHHDPSTTTSTTSSSSAAAASSMHESQAAACRDLAMSAVLPLLPPAASLPCAHRADVHLEYAPFLRAMQRSDEAHALAAAAGLERAQDDARGPRLRRSKRRERRSYWEEKYPGLEAETLQQFQMLALSGMVV